jgi:hypothetical protein
MSKTITKTRNIHSFQDSNLEECEDFEYIRMMITEIDELNLKLNDERMKNDKNEVYIQILEEELQEIYKKYTKIQDDIKYLEDFKQHSKMSAENIKNKIKEKISNAKTEKYDKLNTDELRKIAKDRLNILKQKLNVNNK